MVYYVYDTKKGIVMVKTKVIAKNEKKTGGIELYFKRIFGLMTGAISLTAISAFVMMFFAQYLFRMSPDGHILGLSGIYYIITFGGLGFSIWAQLRAFSMKPSTGAWMLAIYSVLMGIAITPLVYVSLAVHPITVIWAFLLAAAMFGCMALFGYKTIKDLSFLGIFLTIGMIGLILVGIISIFVPLSAGFSTAVSLVGVLVFSLFTAYDMQTLKKAYAVIGNETQRNQLAVLGALHLYISFVALFEYILSFLNSRN